MPLTSTRHNMYRLEASRRPAPFAIAPVNGSSFANLIAVRCQWMGSSLKVQDRSQGIHRVEDLGVLRWPGGDAYVSRNPVETDLIRPYGMSLGDLPYP